MHTGLPGIGKTAYVAVADAPSWEDDFKLGYQAYADAKPYDRNACVAWQQGWKQGWKQGENLNNTQ